MGKDKSKKRDTSKKKGKAPEVETFQVTGDFPGKAEPGADEATAPTVDTDTLSKKEKRAIHDLDLGEVHDFPRGVEQIERVAYLNSVIMGDFKKKARKAAEVELQGYRDRGTALMWQKVDADKKAKAGTKAEPKAPEPEKAVLDVAPEVDDEVAVIKARVQERQRERYEAMIASGAPEEAARQMSRFTALRDEDPKGKTLGKVGAAIMAAELDTDEASEKTDAAGAKALDDAEPEVVAPSKKKAKAQEAEVIETETGREFAVGTPTADDSDLDPNDADRDADGVRWSKHASPRPYIVKPDGKEAIYSRMTSYIDVLDEKGGLQDWKDRMLLVGIARAAAELDPELDVVDIVGTVNDLVAKTEAAIAKADKALKKGKVSVLGHADLVEAAEKTYKSEARALVEDMRDRGGAHEKAQKGTDLHAVFEHFDNAAMQTKGLTVDAWLGYPADGAVDTPTWGDELSPADVADLRAYRAAMDAEGIEVIACEQRVVLDEYGVTGTLDRSIRFTPPGATRKVKGVGDVKTGRLDYGAGKFTTQVYGYAMGEGYANSSERVDLKHSKKWGVIMHSPAGQGKTTIYYVDLSKGVEGWKHIEAVRGWRRTTTEAQTFRGKAPYMFAGATAEVSEDGGIVVTPAPTK